MKMNMKMSHALSRPLRHPAARGAATFAFVSCLIGASLLLSAPAWSAPAPVVPGAGTILQSVQPLAPPSVSPSETGLKLDQQRSGDWPPTAPFVVTQLQISGNTVFDTALLHDLVKDGEGKSLTLAEIGALAERITTYYHQHGYPLARAIVPAQKIEGGIVLIQVLEARYGKIGLNNSSKVDSRLLQSTLTPLQGGALIGQAALDHTLLLLSDIPGVAIQSSLKPGAAVGSSDLETAVIATAAVVGSVMLDNDGSRYTGRARATGRISLLNPLNHGDVLSFTAMSGGSDLHYGQAYYDTLLDGVGTRVGGSYSALSYTLGDTLSNLGGHGTATVASLWLSRPFIRSLATNLYGKFALDRAVLHDRIDASATQTDRHLLNATWSAYGDQHDGWLAGGVSTWRVALISGEVTFENGSAQTADAATANTDGRYVKYALSGVRLQTLSERDTLYVALSGQGANGNLDASQKMVAGGSDTVRAYDSSVLSGDEGLLTTIELRHSLGWQLPGYWQAIAFVDSQHLKINHSPWANGQNTATLSGAGVGLNWSGANNWSARLSVATRIGNLPSLLATAAATRGWIEINKGF